MSGRQSTGPPAVIKAKKPKQKGKRSQNALAIAEQQAPIRSKIRPNRLGQSEPEPYKRKRQDSEENEDSDIEGAGGNVKRRKAGDKDKYGNEIERGSDSSGNEWTIGQVDDDDDSDIDSDEAMAESDDDGAAIKGSKSHSSRSRSAQKISGVEAEDNGLHEIDLREDRDSEGDLGEDDDSFGDEAVDLAAMLDESDDGGDLPGIAGDPNSSGEEEHEHGSDGAGGLTEPTSEDEEAMLLNSEDEVLTEDPAKLAKLKALVSTMNEQDQASSHKAPIDAEESVIPHDFGPTSKRKVSLRETTNPTSRKLSKPLASNEVNSVTKRSGIPRKLDVPLPKRQKDRLDRAAAYEKSKETLNRWIDTVKHNRRAEHLSFPLKDPNAASAQGSTRLLPTKQTQPLTDLESTIQQILQDSGLAPASGISGEDQVQAFEELKTNKMPLEEVQARRAELRRARELLFREEIRAKRIKKIKSKTYRKVHRRDRERNAQQEKDALVAAGVDDSESEQERKDRRRAEERMGARHRESKWAKGVKDSGRAKWDDDARDGVTEMARRGEELKRRIAGKPVTNDGSDAFSSESDDDQDDDHDNSEYGDDGKTQTLQRLSKLDEAGNELESSARASRLASMDFMKNAAKARKARNEADLESVRRDLAGEDIPSDDAEEDGPGRRIFGPITGKSSNHDTPPEQPRSEFEERQSSNDDDDEGRNGPPEKQEEDGLEIIVNAPKTKASSRSIGKSSFTDKRRETSFQSQANENPWLMPPSKGSNAGKKRIQDLDTGAIITNTLPTDLSVPPSSISAPRSALKGGRKTEKARDSPSVPAKMGQPEASGDEDDEDEDDKTENSPFVLRNEDLVRKAFAGDEVVANFEAEKRTTMDEEEEKVIDNTLPGWGSWTGAGLGKKQLKRNKGKVLTKQPGIAKEKRKDAKLDRVIINEKRVKKNGKYLASTLPHPFESKQQYQRSLRMPVGPEFATKLAFQDATKPRILMKQGIITPMAKPVV